MDFTNNNFLDNINPLDFNSSIPATRDLKDSIHALAMINGYTMQEYLDQLISTNRNSSFRNPKTFRLSQNQILL